MATIQAYTDLEQSKKLAEILPRESADMYYEDDISVELGHGWHPQHIPCWSLTALIDIIENIDKRQKVEVSFTHNRGKYWVDIHFSEFGSFCQVYELYDSKVDALVAMIEKIKNRGLL